MFLVISAVSTFVMAALVEDLVDRTDVEARLERLASTDELTGLPNRASLTSFLSGRLTSPSSPTGVGVCVCDLDHFKVVNDGLGHHAGDEVLVEVARRMSGCVRPSDLVARLGGDEFVIVKDSAGDELEDLARRLLVAVAKPMTLTDGTKLTPSVSIGIAHCGPGIDHSSLLRDADAALFRAKELGRGRFHRFDEQLRLQVVDRLFIQTEVQDALANDDLYCVYQPEIVIASGALFSFEALSRWDHPTQGSISPARFIPVIEDIGVAGDLFDHVLEETLDAQAQWAKRLGFHPAVAINLSARQLGDTDLPGTVAKALTRRGAPADSLWIEVTESALAEDTASGILLALHDLGVRLAIDDFGTGWSSMARLAAFPWDLLKIDQSFVQALGGPNQYAEQVVSSTIALAHALGIPTTAEGVETAEQLDRLAEMGCDVAQGYLFARPVPARDAIAHIASDGQWTGPGISPHDPDDRTGSTSTHGSGPGSPPHHSGIGPSATAAPTSGGCGQRRAPSDRPAPAYAAANHRPRSEPNAKLARSTCARPEQLAVTGADSGQHVRELVDQRGRSHLGSSKMDHGARGVPGRRRTRVGPGAPDRHAAGGPPRLRHHLVGERDQLVERDDCFEVGALVRGQFGGVHLGAAAIARGHEPAPIARNAPIPRRPTSARAAAVCPACQPVNVAALAGRALTTRPNAVRA